MRKLIESTLVVKAIQDLEAQPGKDLIKYGTSAPGASGRVVAALLGAAVRPGASSLPATGCQEPWLPGWG